MFSLKWNEINLNIFAADASLSHPLHLSHSLSAKLVYIRANASLESLYSPLRASSGTIVLSPEAAF